MKEEILDKIPSNIYVINVQNYEFIYINDNVKKLVRETEELLGETNLKCYEVIYGYDSPCHFCKIRELLENNDQESVIEFEAFNEIDNKWYSLRENLIRSSSGKIAKYSIGHDITAFKSIQQELTTTYAELIKSNDEVEKLNKSLEQRVKEEVAKVKERDEHIFDQAKMASLGEMIGNIAHQWRQPLSAISTTASGINLNHECGFLKDEDIPRAMDTIVQNTQFLSETIETFRDFIKDGKEFSNLCVQDDIKRALQLVGASLAHSHVKIIDEINYNEGIKMNLVVGELPQVIINLLNNARDIIVEKDIDEDNRWIKLNLEKFDDYVCLTVEDSGGGIPDEFKSKIFEPYFTTKHKSQGTGIGLYMSYDIIVNHMNGNMYAKNTENGAKFFIEIPFERRKLPCRRQRDCDEIGLSQDLIQ